MVSAGIAARFFEPCGERIDFSMLRFPTVRAVVQTIMWLRPFAAGLDGIPYAAFKAIATVSVELLHRCLCTICDGGEVPDDFNSLLAVFIPKGVKDHDTELSCKRTAGETQPLGMKNVDNKIMSAEVDHKVQSVAQNRIQHAQKGFVNGRNGTTEHCRVRRKNKNVRLAGIKQT